MTQPRTPRNILLLCAFSAEHIGTVRDHVRAFENFSRHNVLAMDSATAATCAPDLSLFDAVVFHYSMVIADPAYVPAPFAERLAAYDGPKILYIQDEYRWVDRTAAMAERLGIRILFSVADPDTAARLYDYPGLKGLRIEHTLTGFVPEELIGYPVPDYVNRKLDVVYRARKLTAAAGYFAMQKWQIAERFEADARTFGLRCNLDTSESGRIYGDAWLKFIAGSKATLGTESGVSVIDRDGLLTPAVQAYEMQHPGAAFDEISEKFLTGKDGALEIRAISPRVFEAACLRTLMIMYPGNYSGVVEPGRHYVPLELDHSNMAEVVEIIRSPERAGEIIHNAYEEVAKSPRWTFRGCVAQFDDVIDEITPARLAIDLRPFVGATNFGGEKKTPAVSGDGEVVDLVRRHNRQLRSLRRRMAVLAWLMRLDHRMRRTAYRVLPASMASKAMPGELLPHKVGRIFGKARLGLRWLILKVLFPNR